MFLPPAFAVQTNATGHNGSMAAAPLANCSDEMLMHAYAAGDARAFDLLYARNEGALYRFVRRLLGAAHVAQADEVFQDCWLRIVAARARFAPDARWRPWAFAIAHNAAMDRLRVAGRTLSYDAWGTAGEAGAAGGAADGEPAADALDWLQPAIDAAHPSAEDQAFWRAAGQQLLQCLDALPPAQRAAFLLHHEEGAPLDELANQLEVGFETIKSRLRYAMARLRGCMGAYLDVLEPAR